MLRIPTELDMGSLVRLTNPDQENGRKALAFLQQNSGTGATRTISLLENDDVLFGREAGEKTVKVNSQVFLELTKKQIAYIYYYYGYGWTMQKIAEKCGVNKSTVSRTIHRGLKRLGKRFKIINFTAIGAFGDEI